MMKVVQYSPPATKELLVDHPGNDVILGTQYWFMLLADWALSIAVAGSSLVSGSHVAEPMPHLHSCHHGHFFHWSIGQWLGWRGKKAD